ncbi:MAG: Ig-like domain-containing protein, partial [Bacteroidales bacterium]
MNTLKNILAYNALFLLTLLTFTVVSCNDENEDNSIKVHRLSIENLDEHGVISLIEGDNHEVAVTTHPEEAIDKDAYNYHYTSANESVFTVNESGVITATGVGEAVLSVWSVNNTDLWTTGIVKVEKRIYPVTSITIPEKFQDYYMSVDNTFKLGSVIEVAPDNATTPDVIYRSSDNMIAEVNEHGEVYAKALGDVTITVEATDGSGVTAKSEIHIRDVDYSQLLLRDAWSVS